MPSVPAAEEARVLFLLEEPTDGADAQQIRSHSFTSGSSRRSGDSSFAGGWARLAEVPALELPSEDAGDSEADELRFWYAEREQADNAGSHCHATTQKAAADAAAGEATQQLGDMAVAVGNTSSGIASPHPADEAASCTSGSGSILQQCSSRDSTLRPLRPAGMGQEALLRLLAQAYGEMLMGQGGRLQQGQQLGGSKQELEVWLRQLRELALNGDSDTVLALYSAMKERHAWVRLRDVYSALVHLRDGAALGLHI
jgi:hypothetical protein